MLLAGKENQEKQEDHSLGYFRKKRVMEPSAWLLSDNIACTIVPKSHLATTNFYDLYATLLEDVRAPPELSFLNSRMSERESSGLITSCEHGYYK
jgi:hypothetical protein